MSIFAGMETLTIADEYFETRPTLRTEIQSLERKRGLSLLSKLRAEHDAINFFSALAEIRTGLFFDPLCSELRPNAPVDRKRPDWSFTMNGQHVICEVLRLNTPEEDARAGIEHSREMRKWQLENPGVPIFEYNQPVTIDTAYFCGGQSKLQFKEEKYRGIIENYHLPFIICVNPSIDTFINEIDVNDFLMGKYGFYTTAPNFGRNVAGILLHGYYNGHWVYFPNEKAQFPLDEGNKQLIHQRCQG